MKFKLLLLAVILFAFTLNAYAVSINVFYGEKDYLTLAADLPDNEMYMLNDDFDNPEYADLGVYYRAYVLYDIPLWITLEPQLVLFNANDDSTYYDLDDELVEIIMEDNKLNKEKLLKADRLNRQIGKVLLIIIIIAVIIYQKRKRNKTSAGNNDNLHNS